MDKRQAMTSGFLLPAGQGILTGLLFALVCLAAWQLYHRVNGWTVFFGALAVGSFLGWLFILRRWQAWIDADHGISPAPVAPAEIFEATTVQLEITWADGNAGEYTRLGVDLERFAAWCAGVAQGRPLGENHWTGKTGIFSKGEYHMMRDELELRGLIRLRGQSYVGGYELTSKGRAVVEEMARRHAAGNLDALPSGVVRLAGNDNA